MNQVDNNIHGLLKTLVTNRTILLFGVFFYGELKNNNDGFNLLKQYN